MSNLDEIHYEKTIINGLEIMERRKFLDERGSFERLFSEKFNSVTTENFKIADINLSKTLDKGTVRGMHYQHGEAAETKLVTCVSGSLIDVVIDMRPESSTYLKIFSIKLDGEDSLTLKIPKGCAHGFQSQEDDTRLLYFVDNYYSSKDQRGINPLSDELSDIWPLDVSLISEQDSKWPKFFEFIK
jgi:dTDP-4-dehydrorhamnose 3,5-epimerase